jgi:hypothetical protein
MSTPESGFVAIPRTVLSMAVGVIDTVERAVVGEGRVRTARGNAWEAVCADRARADRIAEVRRQLSQRNVGSSPRSSASQSEVATGARS